MSAAAAPRRHRVEVTVRPEDIDDLGHVNNLVYVRWVQDAAASHWTGVAPAAHQEAMRWVVARHEIDYLASALEGDEIGVVTWVERWRGATSERHTEIVREPDGTVLARARTVWCAVDPGTGRPLRLPPDIAEAFLEGGYER